MYTYVSLCMYMCHTEGERSTPALPEHKHDPKRETEDKQSTRQTTQSRTRHVFFSVVKT